MAAGKLEGKTALVTGAGGAIGGAIARRFSAEGAAVCVGDIDFAGAEATVADIEAAGGTAMACPLDVADPAQAERAVSQTVERLGHLHILVNVAAAPSPRGTVETMALADFTREITVNLTGYFLMAKYAVPAIRAAGGGTIINIASQLGHIGVPARPGYCASKGAILQLTRVMAIDHACDNIRVNSISPGAIDTPRSGQQPGAPQLTREQRGRSYLTGRIGRVDEIAAGAAYLASEEASFMTGADLLIDGGFLAFKGTLDDLPQRGGGEISGPRP
ncbi:MAG: SDR family oxidoreductase [Alphaproteobacteria bacterium]|nr:SDR family oxidoreductase [Alphaproteobacteria bacterium]